jgi:hypothetical protein
MIDAAWIRIPYHVALWQACSSKKWRTTSARQRSTSTELLTAFFKAKALPHIPLHVSLLLNVTAFITQGLLRNLFINGGDFSPDNTARISPAVESNSAAGLVLF